MKCLENVEKLNYNYQVLKRREEENASAKSAQRRKINKSVNETYTIRFFFNMFYYRYWFFNFFYLSLDYRTFCRPRERF